MSLPVEILRLAHARDLPLPGYATAGSAGLDLRAAVPDAAPVLLRPGERALIPTGLSIAIPEGYEAQVRPRSGLAVKHGVTCLNTPGTIDSDYRGELHALLINHGAEPFEVRRGERVAQLVIARHERADWREVEGLTETVRGAGGFGSTGRA